VEEKTMTFTREDLQREYNLGEEDIKETLKACGLSLKKRNYTDEDRNLFARARKLVEEGTANSYDDIANFFKKNGINLAENDDGVAISAELVEHLHLLEQQAMETGFQVGLQQAEIMGKVIPQVTILRLKEMIVTGELRQNFQQIWTEAMTAGNLPSVTEMVEERWREYQLTRYQPLTSLPESSTASSDSDL
jgi:hypothetical protein